MLHITRGWLVLRLADDSPFALALIAGAAAVPVIVVSMIGGALADKVSKKRLLVWGRSGNAAITFVVGTLDLTGVVALWHLFVTAVVDGSLMAINIPSRQALASEVVPEHKLLSAIGLLNTGMNVARILGPVAAGFLIVYLGTGWVFYIVCFWFGLSALSISAMEGGERPPDASRKSVPRDIRDGLAYAFGQPMLFGLIILIFASVLFGAPFGTLLPAWARETLDVQSDALGVIVTISGLGALAGSLVLASLQGFRRRGLLLLGVCAAWGVLQALTSQSSSLIAAAPLLMLIGLAGSMFQGLEVTLLQLNSSPEMRGRVMSVTPMSYGLAPLGALPFGAFAERVGTPDAILVSGVMLAVFTVLFSIGYPRVRLIP